MKKFLSLLLALVFCLSLAACGGSPSAESQSPSQPAEASGEPSQEPTGDPSVQPSEDQPDPSDSQEPGTPSDPSQNPSESAGSAIVLSHTDVTLKSAGASFVLTAEETGTPEGTRPALVWASSDESVAAVTDNGDGTATVTAVSPGKAVITASAVYSTFAPDDPLVLSCIIRCRWTQESAAPAASPSSAPTQPAASGVDLAAFGRRLRTNYQFGATFIDEETGQSWDSLELLDPSDELGRQLLANYYTGLTDLPLIQCLVYYNNFSMNNSELALIQAANAADAAKAAAILQTRVDHMVQGGAWYPEPTEVWTNNSRVVTRGNYVMMVVHSQCDEIVGLFNALF